MSPTDRFSPMTDGLPAIPIARFAIGEVVRHRLLDFRGVIFDVDPEFANSQEWYEAIPEAMRPSKDQPFYHLLAENSEASYVAYVSQQNLVPDDSDEPIDHPAIGTLFDRFDVGRYLLRREHRHYAGRALALPSHCFRSSPRTGRRGSGR
jgi:heat shock protein HspQ